MYSSREMSTQRNLDLHLLRCLDALITERSVTLAAERIGISQPSMSNALARLRRLTKDVLLVRTSQGMVPTPRAHELLGSVQTGLRAFEDVLGQRGTFEPSAAKGSITVAASDYPGMLIFPRVLARLRREAPGLELRMRLPDPLHVREWLTEGGCDIVVGYLPGMADGLHQKLLFSEPLVCALAADQHPTVGDHLSLDYFAQAQHVVFGSPFGPKSTLESMIDDVLSRLGVQRKVGVRVASALMSPHMVAHTQMLAVQPVVFARHFARLLPLRVLPAPFELPPLEVSMVWHERTHRVAMHQWVRGIVSETVREHVLPQIGTAAA